MPYSCPPVYCCDMWDGTELTYWPRKDPSYETLTNIVCQNIYSCLLLTQLSVSFSVIGSAHISNVTALFKLSGIIYYM